MSGDLLTADEREDLEELAERDDLKSSKWAERLLKLAEKAGGSA